MKPLKALFVNPPVRTSDVPRHFPHGLACIINYVTKHRREEPTTEWQGGKIIDTVSLMDLNLDRNFITPRGLRCEEINYDWISSQDCFTNVKWDIIAIGGMITSFGFQRAFVQEVRKIQPQAIIVLGGAGVSSAYGEVYNEEQLGGEFVAVMGEGEKATLEIFNDLSANGCPSKKIYKAPLLKDLDKALTFTNPKTNEKQYVERQPALINRYFRHSSLPNGPHSKNAKRRVDLYSSRSCPCRCKFCYHVFGEGTYRTHSAQYMIDEIKWLQKTLQPDFLSFHDENFTQNRQRVIDFCELLLKNSIHIPWGCASRSSSVDPELLKLMKRAECEFLNFGFESGSQKMLNRMAKGTRVEDNDAAIRYVFEAGINVAGTFVFGFPGECIETALQTAKFAKKHRIYKPYFIATAYPGSWLYDQHRDKIGDPVKYAEKITDQNADYLVANFTDWSDAELLGYRYMTEHCRVDLLEKALAEQKQKLEEKK